MFASLKKLFSGRGAAKGTVGLEVRADGLALALATKDQKSGEISLQKCVFRACNAAERKDILAQMVSELDIDSFPCEMVLPADQYQTFPIEKPKVEESELGDAARWRIKDMLDFDIDNAVTDVYDFPQDALRGRPDQVNVIATRRAIVQDNVDLVTASDLELETIGIADLALRNIASLIANPNIPVAVLYLRHGMGLMVLVKDHALYLARHFDFSMQSLNDPTQQETVIQNLGLEIQRSFDYFESQLGQAPPQNLTLIGPDPSMPLGNMLGGAIAARVENFDWSRLLPEEHKAGLEEINCLLAIGAAIRGDKA